MLARTFLLAALASAASAAIVARQNMMGTSDEICGSNAPPVIVDGAQGQSCACANGAQVGGGSSTQFCNTANRNANEINTCSFGSGSTPSCGVQCREGYERTPGNGSCQRVASVSSSPSSSRSTAPPSSSPTTTYYCNGGPCVSSTTPPPSTTSSPSYQTTSYNTTFFCNGGPCVSSTPLSSVSSASASSASISSRTGAAVPNAALTLPGSALAVVLGFLGLAL